jgi:hypothetical protein
VIDAQTVVVSWKRPFIDADKLFTRLGPTRGRVLPLPKHRLETSYREDKAGFTQLSFWSDDFLGTGPFKLKSWEKGSHLVLEASEVYVLGRPKLDQIEVRFVPDPNTLVASVLAGSVHFTLGRGMALEQALLVRDQWADGHMEVSPASWFMVWPQFLNPSPAVIADVRFRRAMAMALDRQQLSESLTGGISGVAHTYLAPAVRSACGQPADRGAGLCQPARWLSLRRDRAAAGRRAADHGRRHHARAHAAHHRRLLAASRGGGGACGGVANAGPGPGVPSHLPILRAESQSKSAERPASAAKPSLRCAVFSYSSASPAPNSRENAVMNLVSATTRTNTKASRSMVRVPCTAVTPPSTSASAIDV